MPFCKECGAETLPDDVFCPGCGTNLKETGTDKEKAPGEETPKEKPKKGAKADSSPLEGFIAECREKGFSNDEIREELLKAGWKEGPVNKALKPTVPKPVEPDVPKPSKKEPAVPKPKSKKVVPEVPKPKAWPVRGEKSEPPVPQPKKKKKKFWSAVGKILWWLLAIFYICVGYSLFRWEAGPGLFAMFLAVLLLPPASKRFPKWLRIALAIFIFGYFFYFAT